MTTKPRPATAIWVIFNDLANERIRQDEKWGVQSHPDRGDTDDIVINTARANAWKALNDERAENGETAWDGILLEEVYEALSATDTVDRRAELVQVAAVCMAWIEDLDRRPAVALIPKED